MIDEASVLCEETVLAGVRAMLQLAGQDPDRPGLRDTPLRVLGSFLELTDGYRQDPAEILARTFDDLGPVDSVVVVGPIEFTSLCEHHLLPFSGHAWVAYRPAPNRVVGLSKLPRLVDCFAHRLQMQERMTEQITAAIVEHLGTSDAACVVRATHSCMSVRGVRKPDALMTTSSLLGLFRDEGPARAEFLALCT